MIKGSVKKPFTVFVTVMVVIVVGIVALLNMKTNLLPDMELPYMLVITTYPGAGPEKVEEDVTKVMEDALSRVTGVENISSESSENYCIVTLEFVEDTNMDSAMVKVSAAINQAKGYLPEICGNPNIIEISADSVASIYTSVSHSDMDIFELTELVNDTVIPYFERLSGVASVSAQGLVEQTLELRLDQEKIDAVNERILLSADNKLSDAKKELSDAKKELKKAKKELKKQTKELEANRSDTANQLSTATYALNQAVATKAAYEANLMGLNASKTALEAEMSAYEDADIFGNYKQINEMFTNLHQAVEGLESQYGAFSPYSSSMMPEDINDAAQHPEKLMYFKEVVGSLSETEGSGIDETIAQAAGEITAANLQQIIQVVDTRIPQIEAELANLNTEIAAAEAAVDMVSNQIGDITEQYQQAEAGKIEAAAGFGSGDAQLNAAMAAIENGEKELEAALENYEETVKTVRDNANINTMLTLDALSGLIYAQNFSMPVGYIDDRNDNQWMLKIGETYEDQEELYSMVLAHVDGVGDILLSDVATMTLVDNSMDSYAKVNGNTGVILSIYKTSTAGTSEVSKAYKDAAAKLMEDNEGLLIKNLMDQGDYIDIIIGYIVSSMGWGALLAVLILAVFLLDIKPTLVVAFSIPFSVIFAVVLMYFGNISVNIMSLSGLALGIGMLVDNSIVVIENIYRFRYLGLEAPKASVAGTKQVAGAIIGSTLTTVCVFLPIVFTGGMVRSLMLPFALTISFALIASLVVALTVVPTIGSVLFRKVRNQRETIFDKMKGGYSAVLRFCLRFKFIPLFIAIGLFAVSVYLITRVGVVMIPDTKSHNISIKLTMPEDTAKEDAFRYTDEAIDKLLGIEGVDFVGGMAGGGAMGFIGGSNLTGQVNFDSFSIFMRMDDDHVKESDISRIEREAEERLAGSNFEYEVSSSMFGSMTALLGEGVQIDIYGTDTEKLREVSEDFVEILSKKEGLTDVTNGQEEAPMDLHLIVQRDKAIRLGLTTAGVYQQIANRLTTEKTAVTMTVDDVNMNINVVSDLDVLTRENLMDMDFETEIMQDDGTTKKETHKLAEFAHVNVEEGYESILRKNGDHIMTVTATTVDGYNTNLISRELDTVLKEYDMPEGMYYVFGGETENTNDMIIQMSEMALLGFILIYMIMVAQFQSFLSPFIVIFTIPLAFTGGLFGLVFLGEQLTLVSILGLLMLMGTVVNNGIVFVDYANQLRLSGMERREALIQTGKDRLRPILMTALTTILAMTAMIFGDSVSAAMSRGMGIVVAAGLLYATFMTLFIVPVLYDILYKKEVYHVDVEE